jgi:hypothetical protein
VTGTPRYLALDVGAAITRIAVDDTGSELMTGKTPPGSMRDNVSRALRTAPRPAGRLCVTLPDAWFSGSVPAARQYEEVRYACEDELGLGRIIWVGQLAAVATGQAARRGPGRYLIGDIGYTGVRVGSFTVSGTNVRTEAVLTQDGGGWADFDQAVRAAVDGDQLPADWYEQAKTQAERAAEVFKRAAASPDHGDDRAYRLAGRREHRLTARQMTACFAPVLDRLRAGVSAVLGAGPPGTVVLTGGLAWFPLAGQAIRDMLAQEPVIAGTGESVRGALLFARAEMSQDLPAGLGPVSLPVHRVHDGFLREESLELPWTEPFAGPPGKMPPLDREELILRVGGQYRTFRLPGLVPGPHLIGVRPGWSGPGVLVVRPAAGGSAHVVSLDEAAEP